MMDKMKGLASAYERGKHTVFGRVVMKECEKAVTKAAQMGTVSVEMLVLLMVALRDVYSAGKLVA